MMENRNKNDPIRNMNETKILKPIQQFCLHPENLRVSHLISLGSTD